MKIIATILLVITTAAAVSAQDFNNIAPTDGKLSFPDGTTAAYKAYEHIVYVGKPTDTTQCLSIFVPENAKPDAPILLKTYTTDFRSAMPQRPSPKDETGIALQKGIVVCIAGCRGYNTLTINTIEKPNGKKKKKKKATSTETDAAYCGKLPAPLTDLQSAVRYLRKNDDNIPGSSKKIVATGNMAGGGLAALLGATDKIFAVASLAPLADPLMAARSGEWLLDRKGDYPRHLDTLALLIPETEAPLTSNTFHNFLKDILYESVQTELDFGNEIPDDVGPIYYFDSRESDDYALGFDLAKYLDAIRARAPKNGYKNYFTTLATKTYGDKESKDYALNVRQMNLITHLDSTTPPKTKNWYIRHNALDAAVPISESVTLYTMLANLGIGVDFSVTWDDTYDYYELVEWILRIDK